MKANEVKRVYVIYNETTDIDKLVTEDLKEALICAGEQIDDGVDSAYTVLIYEGITKSDYYNGINEDQFNESHSLPEFIAKFSIFKKVDDPENIDLVNKEVYHNMAPEEQLEVLRYIPDVVLVDELARRLREYRSATDAAAEALELMKIFV